MYEWVTLLVLAFLMQTEVRCYEQEKSNIRPNDWIVSEEINTLSRRAITNTKKAKAVGKNGKLKNLKVIVDLSGKEKKCILPINLRLLRGILKPLAGIYRSGTPWQFHTYPHKLLPGKLLPEGVFVETI